MKKEIVVTHIFDDGKVMTDSEFFAKPVEISAEQNVDFCREVRKALAPSFLQGDKIRHRYELTAQRRERLIAQQIEIARQLESLG